MFNDTTTIEPGGRVQRSLQLLVTGGSGVLGHALVPLAEKAGHRLCAPSPTELDLFDPVAVGRAMRDIDAVFHLATRIQPLDQLGNPDAWRENDRLRAEASAVLVDAARAAGVTAYIQPTVAFVYPTDRPVNEDSPIVDGPIVHSALIAERETARFARGGGRGVVLRLGLLDGPSTGQATPNAQFGATLHADDAGRALLAALSIPSGVYNVCRDGERVSDARFSAVAGWHPEK